MRSISRLHNELLKTNCRSPCILESSSPNNLVLLGVGRGNTKVSTGMSCIKTKEPTISLLLHPPPLNYLRHIITHLESHVSNSKPSMQTLVSLPKLLLLGQEHHCNSHSPVGFQKKETHFFFLRQCYHITKNTVCKQIFFLFEFLFSI